MPCALAVYVSQIGPLHIYMADGDTAEARPQKGYSMPQTPHVEQHFTAGETVRDIVIGMSDGLTVPFALAAGLSGAVDSNAMGLGGLSCRPQRRRALRQRAAARTPRFSCRWS
jgi:VIT family